MFPYAIHVVDLPLNIIFREVKTREIAIFEGPKGWSEFSPFLEYGVKESSIWLKAALEGACDEAPKKIREDIEINATIPRTSISGVKNILDKFPGCKTVKIKIDNFRQDQDLLVEVLSIVPEAKIRLDINGKWSLTQAISNLIDYEKDFGANIDYIEQPCSDIDDLFELHKKTKLKIAVDESIRKHINNDFSKLKEIADVAVIKWAPTGGIKSALEIIEKINLPVVVSSALDSSIGISHGLALAQSVPNLYGPCGLGTASFFKSDITTNPFVVFAGKLKNRKIEPDLLDQFKAKPERQLWWQNRIEQIYREGLI
jgi:O-succinylbenzoate synthase